MIYVKKIQICTRCILDETVPDIKFDEQGVCNYCKMYERMNVLYPLNKEGKQKLNKLITQIKASGKNKRYDCVVGVSGGRDSSFTLLMAKKFKLRPLAVHVDNGWNTEISVSNIKQVTSRLGVDLYTVVLDWEEFKDLQLAFLKASVPDGEIPTDIAIFGALHRVAAQEGVRYIIEGHNFRTEGNCPRDWTYMDGRYIRSINKRFGSVKLRDYPNLTLLRLLYYVLIKRIKVIRLLEYLPYSQKEITKIVKRELGWREYGEKHYESRYTRFFQGYILPRKFGIDKRKVHLSAQIRSGQITREAALKRIKKPPISEAQAQEDKEYVLKKLGLSEEEFEKILSLPPKSFRDYPTYYSIIRFFRPAIFLACKAQILPMSLYEKYAK